MISLHVLLLITGLFFLIAALYASAGFGGGSSYLAVLALYLKDFLAVKTIGLLCNLVVVAGGTWLLKREGYFDRRRFLPVVLCGVPLAFYGATLRLSQHTFFMSLGAVLCGSGLLLLMQVCLRPARSDSYRRVPGLLIAAISCGIGFLSGLVGIGGGILLSPVLHLMRWDHPRKIAALASFFILVNSLAGLAGQLLSGTFNALMPLTAVLLLAVFLGGQLGSRTSIRILKPAAVRALTGILVCYIGAKLVLKYTNGMDI